MDYSKQERGNKMKYKTLFVLFFGIVISLIAVNTGFASWPIAYAPAIQGIVLDVTTGQPIENVILEVSWSTSDMGIADRATGSAGHKLIVTDKNGRYRIPSKVMPQPLGGFFSMFDGISITMRHPLYELKYFRLNKDNLSDLRKSEESGKYDIKLLSLEEKYKNIDRTKMYTDKIPMQVYNLGHEIGEVGGPYFAFSKKLGLSKDNQEYVFKRWDEIISKYNQEEKEHLNNRLDNFKNYYNLK
jgi:hypothetical protein